MKKNKFFFVKSGKPHLTRSKKRKIFKKKEKPQDAAAGATKRARARVYTRAS